MSGHGHPEYPLDHCERRGNAIVVAGPFNSGILAGNTKFNYAEAPPAVVGRVNALTRICEKFNIPLQAAALQFPLAHPAVVSCVVGTETAAQLHQNVAWLKQPIPAELWQALRQSDLLHPAAPVPA